MDEEQIDFCFNGTAFPISQTIMIHIVLGCLCNKIPDIIYDDFISYDDWEEQKVCYNGKIKFLFFLGKIYMISNLTKEFRLKSSKLCMPFITYIRIYIL